MSHGGRLVDLATADGVGLQITIDREGRVGIDNSGGPSGEVKDTIPSNDGAWHHVAAVRTGTTYRLYVDGRDCGSVTGTAPAYTRLFVGRRADGQSLYEGSIDEVQVYTRSLGPAEILELYAAAPVPVGEDDSKERCGLMGVEAVLLLALLGRRRR
jgi:hypothetical protein